MEDLLSHDRIISYHRSRPDYKPSPENTLQFAYGDRRYEKFAFDLTYVSNILKLKILNELTDDFHRGDNVTLALLSSDLLNVLINHLIDENNEIRQLVSMIVVYIININLFLNLS